MIMRRTCGKGAIFVLLVATVAAQETDDVAKYMRPSENMALGRPYTLEPAPDYSYCTEPGDATQLTDGVYSEGHFWTQPETVGWQHAKPAVITVDLGDVKPIRGASLRTAAGAAGVYWPSSIYLFVADEDHAYHWAGDLIAMSAHKSALPKEGYATHR